MYKASVGLTKETFGMKRRISLRDVILCAQSLCHILEAFREGLSIIVVIGNLDSLTRLNQITKYTTNEHIKYHHDGHFVFT